MFLPARLRDTTLGDLLATLYRARATGVLDLVEASRRHAVHLRRGLVAAVEWACADPSARFGDLAQRGWSVPRLAIEDAWHHGTVRGLRIGQALVGRGALTATARDAVLDLQRCAALEGLFAVTDAEVRFHAARPLPPGAAEQRPMEPAAVLHGRRRRRGETVGGVGTPAGTVVTRRALAVLGIAPGASSNTVRLAYRARVRALHPDLAPEADETERVRRSRALREVIEAYGVLCGTSPSSG